MVFTGILLCFHECLIQCATFSHGEHGAREREMSPQKLQGGKDGDTVFGNVRYGMYFRIQYNTYENKNSTSGRSSPYRMRRGSQTASNLLT